MHGSEVQNHCILLPTQKTDNSTATAFDIREQQHRFLFTKPNTAVNTKSSAAQAPENAQHTHNTAAEAVVSTEAPPVEEIHPAAVFAVEAVKERAESAAVLTAGESKGAGADEGAQDLVGAGGNRGTIAGRPTADTGEEVSDLAAVAAARLPAASDEGSSATAGKPTHSQCTSRCRVSGAAPQSAGARIAAAAKKGGNRKHSGFFSPHAGQHARNVFFYRPKVANSHLPLTKRHNTEKNAHCSDGGSQAPHRTDSSFAKPSSLHAPSAANPPPLPFQAAAAIWAPSAAVSSSRASVAAAGPGAAARTHRGADTGRGTSVSTSSSSSSSYTKSHNYCTYGRLVPHNNQKAWVKETFVRATCRIFVSEEHEARRLLSDPDARIDWRKVQRVETNTNAENPFSCPFCLESFEGMLAPTLAQCGHIFCTPCVLHYFYSQQQQQQKNKQPRPQKSVWQRCPVCADPLRTQDLRPVHVYQVLAPRIGSEMTFCLVSRPCSPIGAPCCATLASPFLQAVHAMLVAAAADKTPTKKKPTPAVSIFSEKNSVGNIACSDYSSTKAAAAASPPPLLLLRPFGSCILRRSFPFLQCPCCAIVARLRTASATQKTAATVVVAATSVVGDSSSGDREAGGRTAAEKEARKNAKESEQKKAALADSGRDCSDYLGSFFSAWWDSLGVSKSSNQQDRGTAVSNKILCDFVSEANTPLASTSCSFLLKEIAPSIVVCKLCRSGSAALKQPSTIPIDAESTKIEKPLVFFLTEGRTDVSLQLRSAALQNQQPQEGLNQQLPLLLPPPSSQQQWMMMMTPQQQEQFQLLQPWQLLSTTTQDFHVPCDYTLGAHFAPVAITHAPAAPWISYLHQIRAAQAKARLAGEGDGAVDAVTLHALQLAEDFTLLKVQELAVVCCCLCNSPVPLSDSTPTAAEQTALATLCPPLFTTTALADRTSQAAVFTVPTSPNTTTTTTTAINTTTAATAEAEAEAAAQSRYGEAKGDHYRVGNNAVMEVPDMHAAVAAAITARPTRAATFAATTTDRRNRAEEGAELVVGVIADNGGDCGNGNSSGKNGERGGFLVEDPLHQFCKLVAEVQCQRKCQQQQQKRLESTQRKNENDESCLGVREGVGGAAVLNSSSFISRRSFLNKHEGQGPSQKKGDFFLYQSIDGQLCFVHPFYLKCLLYEVGGNEENLQPILENVKVVDIHHICLSDSSIRKRYKCCAHLPSQAQITFVDLDLSSLISPSTAEVFKKEIGARERQRLKREQQAAQAAKQAAVSKPPRSLYKLRPLSASATATITSISTNNSASGGGGASARIDEPLFLDSGCSAFPALLPYTNRNRNSSKSSLHRGVNSICNVGISKSPPTSGHSSNNNRSIYEKISSSSSSSSSSSESTTGCSFGCDTSCGERAHLVRGEGLCECRSDCSCSSGSGKNNGGGSSGRFDGGGCRGEEISSGEVFAAVKAETMHQQQLVLESSCIMCDRDRKNRGQVDVAVESSNCSNDSCDGHLVVKNVSGWSFSDVVARKNNDETRRLIAEQKRKDEQFPALRHAVAVTANAAGKSRKKQEASAWVICKHPQQNSSISDRGKRVPSSIHDHRTTASTTAASVQHSAVPSIASVTKRAQNSRSLLSSETTKNFSSSITAPVYCRAGAASLLMKKPESTGFTSRGTTAAASRHVITNRSTCNSMDFITTTTTSNWKKSDIHTASKAALATPGNFTEHEQTLEEAYAPPARGTDVLLCDLLRLSTKKGK